MRFQRRTYFDLDRALGSGCTLTDWLDEIRDISLNINGRGERIRTSGLLVPNQARYQASLRPDGLRQPFYHSLIAPSPQLAVLSNTR